ncbi:MAG TPA: ABC transporter ATP-binding protein [Candidatus Angelobacter sp.]|nr:ABC transporter ATP-binding protein [Candidatus Angelobacter sp.]
MLKTLKAPFQHKRLSDPFPQGGHSLGEKRGKEKPKDRIGTVKRIGRYLLVNKMALSIVFFMVIVSSALGLLGPYTIGKTIDHYLLVKNSKGLTKVILELVFIYGAYSLFLWAQNILMVGIAQKTVYSMRVELFQKLQILPIRFFDRRQHGELMSRVTNDIDNVSSTLNDSVVQLSSSLIILVGTLVVMLWLSPLLTVVTLLIVPMMFLGMRWITKRTSGFFKTQQRNLGQLNGYIEEIISGQRIVKTFSQEEKAIENFTEKSANLRESGFWAQTYSGFIPKLMNGLNNLGFSIVAGVGGLLAVHGYVSIGTIVIFTEYTRQFTRPLNDLSNQFNTLLSAVAGAERVFEILDEEAETKDELSAGELPETIDGNVSFNNVSFSYEDAGETISNVSFDVSAGETVALVGATGAGKTTLVNLLSRFYEVGEGSITIDGYDISEIKRNSLRSKMGFVLQDSYLFQGTIRENIRYGRLNATDEEVEEAAKQANAYSFIMKLPQKFDTILKADGGGISQGQRQLLSIARAILAKPTLLILDEATSSIDTVTEVKIQEALGRLMEGRTSFVIAHRLNTIQRANQILVLNQGRVIERGSHEELMRRKGYYYELQKESMRKTEGVV